MRTPRMTKAARARGDQAGTVLVLFAVLVIALLGIAALGIDMGLARLSQAQMQTAADTAALEGLRLRDFHEYRALGDPYRRPRVGELVQQVFDDDFHPTAGTVATLEPTAPHARDVHVTHHARCDEVLLGGGELVARELVGGAPGMCGGAHQVAEAHRPHGAFLDELVAELHREPHAILDGTRGVGERDPRPEQRQLDAMVLYARRTEPLDRGPRFVDAARRLALVDVDVRSGEQRGDVRHVKAVA